MDAQNRNPKASGEPREKFPEPQGWALKWDAFAPPAPPPMAPPSEAQEAGPTNGVRDKFPEPRGWAANWDGSVLGELDGRQNGRVA